MAAKNTVKANKATQAVKPAAPVAPVAPVAPAAPTAAELYKAAVARQAETHAVLTARTAPFCMRAGRGTRAWALDLALCQLHAKGERIDVQNMCRVANELLAAEKSPVFATPGSHFAAMIQRGYLAKGAAGYVLTEHGIKQAQACGALPADEPKAKGKPKGKK